jgi:large subunit ribosomal protein L28
MPRLFFGPPSRSIEEARRDGDPVVPRICFFCGKKTQVGNHVTRRGLAKKTGGIGLKTTGIRRRTFKPNLQKVHALVAGRATRIRVCTSCLKRGRVTKQLRRERPAAPVPAVS